MAEALGETTGAEVRDAAVTVTNLTKSFGHARALDGFSLTVPTGQVTGFLGPNGAGKSTTIRILLGMLRADAGHVDILGRDPWRDAVDVHADLAYVPGDISLWPGLTGGEAIDILTRTERGTGHRARRERLIERFELDPGKKARTYSKGNRQKVALVAALSREVDLYLFDEPTSGLDPLMEAVFTDEVRALRQAGRTVLLSSHILAEVEKLCDRVTIIRGGRDVESGTLDELRHLTRSTVTARVSGDVGTLADADGVHDLTLDGDSIRFDADDHAIVGLLPRLVDLRVTGLTITPPSLEEMFMRHYGDDIAGDDPDAPDRRLGSAGTSGPTTTSRRRRHAP